MLLTRDDQRERLGDELGTQVHERHALAAVSRGAAHLLVVGADAGGRSNVEGPGDLPGEVECCAEGAGGGDSIYREMAPAIVTQPERGRVMLAARDHRVLSQQHTALPVDHPHLAFELFCERLEPRDKDRRQRVKLSQVRFHLLSRRGHLSLVGRHEGELPQQRIHHEPLQPLTHLARVGCSGQPSLLSQSIGHRTRRRRVTNEGDRRPTQVIHHVQAGGVHDGQHASHGTCDHAAGAARMRRLKSHKQRDLGPVEPGLRHYAVEVGLEPGGQGHVRQL
mmetsp:Transcript_18014/g.42903  ORF Transcript_18014/g.42903 Transcript_18014/m.42903 type:complete len:279 (+) Transcript_18014:586-1422(+)